MHFSRLQLSCRLMAVCWVSLYVGRYPQCIETRDLEGWVVCIWISLLLCPCDDTDSSTRACWDRCSCLLLRACWENYILYLKCISGCVGIMHLINFNKTKLLGSSLPLWKSFRKILQTQNKICEWLLLYAVSADFHCKIKITNQNYHTDICGYDILIKCLKAIPLPSLLFLLTQTFRAAHA